MPKSVNYRHINPQAVAFDVLKQRAWEAEKKAYGIEVQLEHLQKRLAENPKDGQLAVLCSQFVTDLPKKRRLAVRAAGASPLTEEEVTACHIEFLNEWMSQVEKSLATHSTLQSEAERQLGLEGEDALNDEERTEVMQERETAIRGFANLQEAHAYVVERIGALAPPDEE